MFRCLESDSDVFSKSSFKVVQNFITTMIKVSFIPTCMLTCNYQINTVICKLLLYYDLLDACMYTVCVQVHDD